MKRPYIFLLAFLILHPITAQTPASTAQDIADALERKQQMHETSAVKNLKWRSVGPTIMSGRVVDLAVNPDDPTEFYVAYASGGVWHTKNNGTSFEPILDNAMTHANQNGIDNGISNALERQSNDGGSDGTENDSEPADTGDDEFAGIDQDLMGDNPLSDDGENNSNDTEDQSNNQVETAAGLSPVTGGSVPGI